MSEQIKVPARLFRAGQIDVTTPDPDKEDDRRVELSFSSEEPVLRHFRLSNGKVLRAYEVLGHEDGEVDLAQLSSGRAPLLTDHAQTIDSQVGLIDRVWIRDGKGYAAPRFGKGARASEVLARVRDGEITGVSAGYEVLSLTRVGERDGLPILRARWRPYEITLCPIPADPTVGIGRSADGDTEIQIPLDIETKGPDMTGTTETTTETRAKPAAPNQVTNEDLMRQERARVKDINTMGRKFGMSDADIDAAIENETSVASFQRSILDKMDSADAEGTRAKNAEVGLSTKEVKQFSLARAVDFLIDPTSRAKREAAAFEIEVSEAAQDKLGRSAKGILVPNDILASQDFSRAQNTGTPSAGGALVGTEHMDGSFIGLLRKRAALTRLGVRTLSGLSDNISIPRQTGGATADWVNEGGNPADSESTFDAVTATPHTLAGAVPMTRRFRLLSSPDGEGLVRDDLIKALALEVDRVGINGDANPAAPQGLLDQPITDVDFATAGQPTWQEIVAMESAISADDADVEAMKYLFNAQMRGHLKSTPKVAGTAEFIMKGKDVNGYDSVTSNNSPAGGAILGNWSDLIMCMWSGLDLTVDTATLASSGGIYLRAFQDLDFINRHDESFAYGRDYL